MFDAIGLGFTELPLPKDIMMYMKQNNQTRQDKLYLVNCIVIIVTLMLFASPVQSLEPWFTHPSAGDKSRSCSENIPASSSIYRVALSDSTGYNVTIQSQIPSDPPFQLEKNGLDWTLKSPAYGNIDRETTTNFTFVFNATNGMSSVPSEILTLIVTDINDNNPQFRNDSYELTIYNSMPAGTISLTIQATDADESPTITYSITAGDANKTFAINPNTGQLNLTTPSNLNANTKPTFNLTVLASDGTNGNCTTVIIHVVEDLCIPSPCANGTCSRNHTNYTCRCNSGWLGDRCQTADPCLSAPCVNGTCHGNGTGFMCSCNVGWFGETCNEEYVADPCLSSPCLNGSTCNRTGTNYTCDSPIGGLKNNGEQVDPCFPNPCKNGGMCVMNGTAFTCNCTSGFHGSECNVSGPTTSKSQGDPCISQPCKHGGTCMVVGTLFRCQCVSGMMGNTCSTMVATAASQTDSQGRNSDSSSKLLAVYIVVPMLIVVGIMVAAIVIYKCKMRQKVADDFAQAGPRNQCFESSNVPNKDLLRHNGPRLPPINKSNFLTTQ